MGPRWSALTRVTNADSKKFAVKEYTDEQYEGELKTD